MSETLLRTKLYKPPVRPSLVPRPHLVDQLFQALAGKLMLLSAPAGYGKTTLLAAGLPQAAWLSQDKVILVLDDYHIDEATVADVRGNVAILRGYSALQQNNPPLAMQYMEDSLAILPENDTYMRSLVAWSWTRHGLVYLAGCGSLRPILTAPRLLLNGPSPMSGQMQDLFD
jgi:hypothetical protein